MEFINEKLANLSGNIINVIVVRQYYNRDIVKIIYG